MDVNEDAGEEQSVAPTSLEEQLEQETSSPRPSDSSTDPELAIEQQDAGDAEGDNAASLTSDSEDAEQRSEADPPTADEADADGASAPASADDVDWKARYAGLQRRYNEDRQAQEAVEAKIAAMEARLQQADSAQRKQALPASDPQSPRHAQFQDTYRNYQVFRQQMQGKTDEQKTVIAEAWADVITPEAARECLAYEQQLAEQNRRFHADPVGTMREQLRGELATMLDERERTASLVGRYQQLVRDNAALVDRHREAITQAVSQGHDFEAVLREIKLTEDLQALRSQISTAEKATAQAKERKRLAQGEVSDPSQRDALTAGEPGEVNADQIWAEAVALAKKAGVDPVSHESRFRQFLTQVEAKYGI